MSQPNLQNIRRNPNAPRIQIAIPSLYQARIDFLMALALKLEEAYDVHGFRAAREGITREQAKALNFVELYGGR